MLRSMTGFGKGMEKCSYGKVIVEIKTLNHKTLSITCNMVNELFLLEEKIKKTVESYILRGKVFVRISREPSGKNRTVGRIDVNETTMKEYLRKIRSAQKRLGIKGDLEIRDIIGLPGVLEAGTGREEVELWSFTEKALKKALDKLLLYRTREGAKINRDFRGRLNTIRANIKKIRKHEKLCVEAYRKKLTRSIKEIADDIEPDKGKLETEVALFAKNCDIAEEIMRLEGHLSTFREVLEKLKSDAGKKLDFIAQEMHRETNTIGAKSSDLFISRSVIEVKSEIEKIREQLRNVE